MVQWAYSSKNKSTSAPRVEGSKLSSSSFSFRFIYGHTQACFKSETNFISGDEMTEDRENAGAADQQTEGEEPAGVSGLDVRERLSVRLRTRERLNGYRRLKRSDMV